MLSVELPVPIFSVALHANVKMELLDTDATVAIVSETEDPTLQKAGRRSGGENGESGIQLSNTIGRYGAPSAGGEELRRQLHADHKDDGKKSQEAP